MEHLVRLLSCRGPLGYRLPQRLDGQRRWSFDRRGELIAHKSISFLEDRNGNREIFFGGREKDDCRFKVGDIVEIPTSGKSINIGIICQMPIDMDFAKLHLPSVKSAPSFHLDGSDDSWWCILHSEEKKKSISFISGPKMICYDIRRLIDES